MSNVHGITKTINTTAGLITITRYSRPTEFARAVQYKVEMKGRKAINLYQKRKSGWWTAEAFGAGEFDLQPFVHEFNVSDAFTAALTAFWKIKGPKFDVAAGVEHVLHMLNEFGVNVKRAVVAFDPKREFARIYVRRHVICIHSGAVIVDHKTTSCVVSKPTKANVRAVLREHFA